MTFPIRPPVRELRLALVTLVVSTALVACGKTSGEGGGRRRRRAERLRGAGAGGQLARWKERFGSRVPRPDSVRALYVNGWAAGGRTRRGELIRIADETPEWEPPRARLSKVIRQRDAAERAKQAPADSTGTRG